MKKEVKKQSSPEDIRLSSVEAPAEGYIIGVDGGGTKTIAALADLNGRILKIARSGSSSPQNIGVKKSSENITKAIKKVSGKNIKIISTFIGLAAIEEEPRFKKEVKKELKKHKEIFKIFEGRVEIGSDQVIAFRAGTDEKDGVVLISGTGCVAHGWKGKKEAKVSGWGWLADEGSGFWASQKGFQAVSKELDGRGKKTKITKLIFKEWKLKEKEDLFKKVYSKDSIRQISSMSGIIDRAAEMGDKIAISIMTEAGRELVQAAISVIKKLNFKNQKFPLVLVGRMFRSKIVLKKVKSQLKKFSPKVKIIKLKKEPVMGAVKLAIDNLR